MTRPMTTQLKTVQQGLVLLMDIHEDQTDMNEHTIKALKEIVGLVEKIEASHGLLEARVQMLEADDD